VEERRADPPFRSEKVGHPGREEEFTTAVRGGPQSKRRVRGLGLDGGIYRWYILT
jgi:hypothetical protein